MAAFKKFPNIRSFAWKSTKMQKWNTQIKRSGSGKVRTMTTWRYPQWTISTSFAYLSYAQYKEMMGFFASLRGAYEPFLWLDPEDNEEINIPLGRGKDKQWQALRRMGDYLEPVDYIEDVILYADGVRLENVTTDGGFIQCTDTIAPDALITADYTYWWLVQLADDSFTAEATYKNIFKSKEMKLVSVRI